ncbi:MAG: hypothetical protein ACI97A_003447 [Planctomycetota bacterium]|jgi:hypothetical protein
MNRLCLQLTFACLIALTSTPLVAQGSPPEKKAKSKVRVSIVFGVSKEPAVGAEVFIRDSFMTKELATLRTAPPSKIEELAKGLMKKHKRWQIADKKGQVLVPSPVDDAGGRISLIVEMGQFRGFLELTEKSLEKGQTTVTLIQRSELTQSVSVVDPKGDAMPQVQVALQEARSGSRRSKKRKYRMVAISTTGGKGEPAVLQWSRDPKRPLPDAPLRILIRMVTGELLSREIDIAELGQEKLVIPCPNAGSVELDFVDDLGKKITAPLLVMALQLPAEARERFLAAPSHISPQLSDEKWSETAREGKITIYPVVLGHEVAISVLSPRDRKYTTRRFAVRGPTKVGETIKQTVVLARSPLVSLRIVDKDGNPLVRQKVQYRGWDSSGWTDRFSGESRTDENGGFQFALLNLQAPTDSRPFILAWVDPKSSLVYEATIDLGKDLKVGVNDLGKVTMQAISGK